MDKMVNVSLFDTDSMILLFFVFSQIRTRLLDWRAKDYAGLTACCTLMAPSAETPQTHEWKTPFRNCAAKIQKKSFPRAPHSPRLEFFQPCV
jgi:hypothetical protein